MSTLVIAEIGACHEGNLDEAKRLIEKAREAGADVAKFQSYRPELLVSSLAADRIAHFRRLALSWEATVALAEHARHVGIEFLSTPFDVEMVGLLDPLVRAFKISSGDLTFVPLLREAARRAKAGGKRIYLSTGLADDMEIERAIGLIRAEAPGLGERGGLVLLHCVTRYPVPDEAANLRSIPHLRARFGLPVGYSDHVPGIEASLASVALGACVVEKHFTLDKTRTTFRDHALSADPADLAALVRGIRRVERLLGTEAKSPGPEEAANRPAFRRSVYLARDVRAGEAIAERDLVCLRPLADGIPSERHDGVVGRRAARDLRAGGILREADLSGGAR